MREAVTGALDADAVLRRRDEVVHDLDDAAQLPWLEEHGITLVRGHGRLAGERIVRVGDAQLLRARRAVVIATGSDAAMPPIPGLAEARPWTNREATTSRTVPPRLLVLGGGVVGVEMAQAYASLGSAVTLVEGGPRVLAREEPFAGEAICAALRRARRDDPQRRAGSAAVARPQPGGAVTLTLDDGRELTGDELLVAVGRRPATGDLGLETVGLKPGEYVPVDDRMRVTGHDWLYAIGDANGCALLTHMGKYEARIASLVIDGDESARVTQSGPRSPRVIFTDPQVAAVGLTEALAREAGLAVRTVSVATDAHRRRELRRPRAPAARRSSSSTPRAASSSARRSSASRSASGCRRRRSPSSTRSRSSGCGTACRRSRPAARCGCGCSRPTRRAEPPPPRRAGRAPPRCARPDAATGAPAGGRSWRTSAARRG